jgi:hypothetical protein
MGDLKCRANKRRNQPLWLAPSFPVVATAQQEQFHFHMAQVRSVAEPLFRIISEIPATNRHEFPIMKSRRADRVR